jgi:purine-binding chemotaxis protein CheW
LGEWYSTERNVDFQVLYFDVNGVTFAVPLDELGGIHRISEMNHLIGRPDWYLGLQTSREAQLDVVDTAKWVMAEKLKDEEYKDSYQYIVMLGESMWGLASTELKGTESLNPDMVRWRATAGKRPWLAGMVTEKMCALIHVEALIAMLNAGLDVKALDN